MVLNLFLWYHLYFWNTQSIMQNFLIILYEVPFIPYFSKKNFLNTRSLGKVTVRNYGEEASQKNLLWITVTVVIRQVFIELFITVSQMLFTHISFLLGNCFPCQMFVFSKSLTNMKKTQQKERTSFHSNSAKTGKLSPGTSFSGFQILVLGIIFLFRL